MLIIKDSLGNMLLVRLKYDIFYSQEAFQLYNNSKVAWIQNESKYYLCKSIKKSKHSGVTPIRKIA